LEPDPDVKRLSALADELFEARDGRRPVGPGLEEAVGLLRANCLHWLDGRRAPLPAERTGSSTAYVADIWLHRPYLRGGHINRAHGRALSCLATPGPAGAIELLPWDEEVGPRVAVAPAWLRWNDGCVLHLARTIAAERAFDQLPILADALEEA